MNVDRHSVVGVIIDIREAVLVERVTGAARMTDPIGSEIFQRACADHGMSVDVWLAALEDDPDLMRLFEQALDELVTESPDPGPYDAISRESPRGAPEPLPHAFARDARLLGRMREP